MYRVGLDVGSTTIKYVVLDEEKNIIKKVLDECQKRTSYFPYKISNEELRLFGSAIAKIHLQKVVECIRTSSNTKFKIDFFCYNLRLFVNDEREPRLILDNQYVGQMTMYKLGYGEVIDKYFGTPIIEKTEGPLTYCFSFVFE